MEKPVLVILGSGFGAFSILKNIDGNLYDVVVVSPRNHFLFTPLLPSTTVGTLEFRSIIEPIRTVKQNIRYYQATCVGIDAKEQVVQCEQLIERTSFNLRYDYLAIAVGASVNTYGIPGVEQYSLFLKDISDARVIRRKIIDSFERAATPGIGEAERKRMLHFVVVGGGPTGIEFAAELHDFLDKDLRDIFDSLIDDVRVTVLEAADHILTSFDEALSQYASKQFRRQRIDVRTNAFVAKVDERYVHLRDGTLVPYGFLLWSTGLAPAPLVRASSFPKDKNSKIMTDEYLKIEGFPSVYAIGDCAIIRNQQLPFTAQVAQQKGYYVAHSLNGLAHHKQIQPFRYKHLGMLAYVGGNRALADLSSFKGRGFTAWLFWRSTYLTKLVSLKNKVLVIFDWIKTLIFGRDISSF